MDADVTDSAGAPTGSDGQAHDADAERAADAETDSAADGEEPGPPSTASTDAEAEAEVEADPGSEPVTSPRSSADSTADTAPTQGADAAGEGGDRAGGSDPGTGARGQEPADQAPSGDPIETAPAPVVPDHGSGEAKKADKTAGATGSGAGAEGGDSENGGDGGASDSPHQHSDDGDIQQPNNGNDNEADKTNETNETRDDGEDASDGGAAESAPGSTSDAPLTPLAVEPKVAPDTTVVTESQGSGDGSEPPKRKRHWLRWAALGTSLVLLAASGAAWWFYRKLDANITTDTTAAAELRTYEKERPTPLVLDAQNILLLGSDTREGKGNSKYGRDEAGSQRADTAILLHIAANRQSATAMSIPRDLMVTIPSCRKADGSRSKEQFAQFNWAFMFGGAACSIRTVEQMTGVRIDHHIVVDFRGFKKMVDAVDGVEVCLKEPIDDKAARLKLKAGLQTLDGEEALGFVRARKTLGDGSDTERMERQQQFLGALVKKVQSNGVLLNLTKLYPVLDAATKSLTTDPGLDSLRDLYDLAKSMERIPTEKVQFLTVPRQPYSANRNRDELVQPDARELFKRLREDTPITVLPRDSRDESDKTDKVSRKPEGSSSASPTPSPSFTGTNAAEGMCE